MMTIVIHRSAHWNENMRLYTHTINNAIVRQLSLLLPNTHVCMQLLSPQAKTNSDWS